MGTPVPFSPTSRLFITGGTGFFGKAILRKLRDSAALEQIAAVVVLSRDPKGFLQRNPEFSRMANLSFHQGDLLSFGFPKEPFTHLIHAATDTNNLHLTDPLRYFDEILLGTRRVLDFAVASGVKSLLLTSSGAIYGPQPAELEAIPETYLGAPSTVDPRAVYGQAKRAAEQLCRIYYDQFDLGCRIARCFSFIGRDMPLDGQYAIGNFIRDALSSEVDCITVQGDGTPVRSYLHTDDLADWLLKILQQGDVCHPYNVGSDEAVTMADLARRVRDLLAPGKAVVIAQQRPDYGGRSRYIPSIERICRELDVRVKKRLGESILDVAGALR